MWVTAGHLVVGLTLWAIWLATQNEAWIRYFFDCQSPVFFLSFAALELYFGVVSWMHFSPGEPLRPAWLLIVLGSICRLTGLIIAHVHSVNSFLNPYHLLGDVVTGSMAADLRQLGLAISGPVHMILLASGLLLVVSAYRKLGLATRLRFIDHVLLGLVVAYTVRQGYEVVRWAGQSRGPITVFDTLHWVTDPLLSLLLLQAILLRRYVISMGWGLIGKCWGAFTVAIFATSLGNMGMWAASYEYIPWPLNSVTWYIWYVASAAYTLGPAYQVEAILRAKEQLEMFRGNSAVRGASTSGG